MADQTPIPADWLGSCPPDVADGAVAVGMGYESWPTRLVAAIDAAYAAGLAAGRTRPGCCQAAVDSDGHTHAETCVYLLGLREGRAEGRTAAAREFREQIESVGLAPEDAVALLSGFEFGDDRD